MITYFERKILSYFFLMQGIWTKKENLIFQERCFTGWGRYLSFSDSLDISFISDMINVVSNNKQSSFYFACMVFHENYQKACLQVTTNTFWNLSLPFTEEDFCLIKDFDFESIDHDK